MGFNFGSFVAGAAENITDTLKKDEEEAAKAAKFGVQALNENYKKVMADNRKIETDVTDNIKALRTFDPTATESELFAAATNKTYMTMALDMAKANPASFRVADVVKITEENPSKLTALERLKQSLEIKVGEKEEAKAIESTGNFLNDIRAGAASRAGRKAEEQTAQAMGISIEKLRAANVYTKPDFESTGAAFNMAKFQEAKGWDKQEKDAKVALLNAEKSGDPKAIRLAQADMLIFSKVNASLTSEQQQFSNKIADIKNRYMFGTTEERKAAKPEYDKLLADVKAEAMAKKTGEGAGEGKIPALGTLNTFTSAAVARAIAAKHGDLIKSKQLAIVEKVDGSVGIDYIGDNDVLRRQILATQSDAAKNALSLYTDAKGEPLNRDVASVINSYTSVVPSVVRTDGGAAPAAAGPTRPTVPKSTQGKTPPQQAIDLLKANPSTAADFEKKYPGYSAKTYIGQ